MKKEINIPVNQGLNQNYENDNNYNNFDDFDDFDNNLKNKKIKKIILVIVTIIVLAVVLDLLVLLYNGHIWFNSIGKKQYPVIGITASELNGELNFESIFEKDYTFAYLSASIGEDKQDNIFKTNWEKSKDSEIYTGAIHKYNFGDDPESQANNYIRTVGKLSERLYPAVEINQTGTSFLIKTDKNSFLDSFYIYIQKIKDEYGVYPIIICGEEFYKDYFKDEFENYTFWIKSTFSKPLSYIDWKFWNYNPRVSLPATSNSNSYFDASCYRLSKGEFSKLIL